MKLRISNEKLYSGIRILISLLLSFLLGGIIISFAGFSPVEVYVFIIKAAFGSFNAIMTTLHHAMPLIFTGMAFMFAQKSGLLNLGTEGQLYVGAIAAALAGAYFPAMPAFIEIPFIMAFGMLFAGLYAGFAAWCNVKFQANMVILTLMMNYIAQLFGDYLVSFVIHDPQGVARSPKIHESAQLGRLVESHYLSSAIIIAVICVIVCWVVCRYSKYGYHMSVVGNNRHAALAAGIKVNGMVISAMFISGAIAGLCGVTQVMGVQYRFIPSFSSGFGFQGIAVAALAGNNPLALFVSSLLWGGMKAGATEVNRIASVPMDIIMNIQALVVIFIASPHLMDALLRPLAKAMHVKEANK